MLSRDPHSRRFYQDSVMEWIGWIYDHIMSNLRNTMLTTIYSNNNHIYIDDWVFGIVDLVYSLKNEILPTQCNVGKPQARKQIVLRNIA